MIKFNINNGRAINLMQTKPDGVVAVVTSNADLSAEDVYNISPGDFVMLLNYYRYIKDNDVQCDFINPGGRWRDANKY